MKFEQNPRYYDILFSCGGGGYDLSVFLDDVSSSKMNIHWLPLWSLSYIIYLASCHAYFHRELVPVRLSAFFFLFLFDIHVGVGERENDVVAFCVSMCVERRICCGVVMLMVQTQYLSRRPPCWCAAQFQLSVFFMLVGCDVVWLCCPTVHWFPFSLLPPSPTPPPPPQTLYIQFEQGSCFW